MPKLKESWPGQIERFKGIVRSLDRDIALLDAEPAPRLKDRRILVVARKRMLRVIDELIPCRASRAGAVAPQHRGSDVGGRPGPGSERDGATEQVAAMKPTDVADL